VSKDFSPAAGSHGMQLYIRGEKNFEQRDFDYRSNTVHILARY